MAKKHCEVFPKFYFLFKFMHFTIGIYMLFYFCMHLFIPMCCRISETEQIKIWKSLSYLGLELNQEAWTLLFHFTSSVDGTLEMFFCFIFLIYT